ncbi:MAG: multiheme c-type cytochrome [Candidatus Thorarchaeota archaeon]
MVYYNEIPEVNKRMVAGYYLFLCLIGFAILLGPTGSGIPITIVGTTDRDEHDALLSQPNWAADPTGCAGCHGDRYGNWSISAHARAAVWNGTHVLLGNLSFMAFTMAEWNASSCAACHTTGWDNSTGTPTYDFLGVNCFQCHDINAPEWVDYSGTVCQSCHYGDPASEHPHQVDWQNSAHANSLTDLRSSSHAAAYCMHCMSGEGFIHQQNPGELATTSPNVNTTFAVDGDYNSVTCPTCHAVHSNWTQAGTPSYIRAINVTELCGLCHTGSYQPQYDIWIGSPMNLAGVECTDCHGYDLAQGTEPFLNHTFAVDPEVACGQSDECHMGMENWATGQLDMTHQAFLGLTAEITAEAASLRTIVETYNATAGADHAVANTVLAIIDDVESTVRLYETDGSKGFHFKDAVFKDLNSAYVDLLEAKAYFYENTAAGETATVTVTTTVTVPGPGVDTLLLVGGSVGGIALGLVLGVFVGRRR